MRANSTRSLGQDMATASSDLVDLVTEPAARWKGHWVAGRLGLSLCTTDSAFGLQLADFVGLAVRRNPLRAHLLVSAVLGKHVPTDPRLVYGSGALLGLLVAHGLDDANPHPSVFPGADFGANLRDALAGDADAATAMLAGVASADGVTACPPGTVVVGFAETATALGHVVADALGAPYIHSTRRLVPGVPAVGEFEEEHSHATSHLLLPADPNFFATGGPLVLVDDEVSTGQTALNMIVALHSSFPRASYVIASLVDLRSPADRQRMAVVAAELGVTIRVVALATGRIELPADVLDLGSSLVAARLCADGLNPDAMRDVPSDPGSGASSVTVGWPKGMREGGRHGFSPADKQVLVSATTAAAANLVDSLAGSDVLVLGHEELMYAPLCLALGLAGRVPSGVRVRFSTTTRSPILAVDDPGYAIRTKLTFPAHDDPSDGPGDRFAYNIHPGGDASGRFTDVVLVVDTPADTSAMRGPTGLISVLGDVCDRVHVIVVPTRLPDAAVPSQDPA